eukprot:gene6014-6712_t
MEEGNFSSAKKSTNSNGRASVSGEVFEKRKDQEKQMASGSSYQQNTRPPSASLEKSSEEYARKRMRNNMAVKKSRDRSKKRIIETQERVDQLTRENGELNQKVTLLSKELTVLRALFTNGGFTVPCNLQIVAQNPVAATTTTTNGLSKQPAIITSNSNHHHHDLNGLPRVIQQQNGNSSSSSPSASLQSPVTASSNHTSVIRSSVVSQCSSKSPCHGVILVTEPGKMNLDIQTGIQFKEELN